MVKDLKEEFKKLIKRDNFSSQQTLKDRLKSLEELNETMDIRGRQFNTENIEREIEILDQRLNSNKVKSKNFFIYLSTKYP